MIRLTPLREIASFQEILTEDRIALLMLLIGNKFSLSDELRKALQNELESLAMDTLRMLFTQVLPIDSLEQLERWIAASKTMALVLHQRFFFTSQPLVNLCTQ